MRVGTWNLHGRWDARHLFLIETMDCDVLLLTEVSERVELPRYDLHLGCLPIMPKRRWAAVASRLPIGRGDRLGPGAVALGRAGIGAFMGFGADERGRFGIDELLQHHLQRFADDIGGVG